MEVAKALEESGLGWTRLMVGCFPETCLCSNMLGMHLASGEIEIYGDGKQKACFTTMKDCARFIVECVMHPEMCMNKVIRVAGDCVTLNDAVGMYEKMTGKKVDVHYRPMNQLQQTMERLQNPTDKAKEQITLCIVNGEAMHTKGLDNDKFNFKATSLNEFFMQELDRCINEGAKNQQQKKTMNENKNPNTTTVA